MRMPVQEGEAEEVRMPQRPPDQFPPEGVEGPAEVHARLHMLHEEGDVGPVAEFPLGVVAHGQRQALLAAVVPVQRAHREAHGPRQLAGLHVVVAPPRQQRRRRVHGLGVHHLQNPHPLPLPAPRRLPAGMNVPSASTCLPGGSDMGRAHDRGATAPLRTARRWDSVRHRWGNGVRQASRHRGDTSTSGIKRPGCHRPLAAPWDATAFGVRRPGCRRLLAAP